MQKLEKYLRSGHKAVEGWLEPAALEIIPALLRRQRALGISGSACEIGVHHGRLLILLQLLTAGQTVGWDLFDQQAENVDGSGEGDRQRALHNFRYHGDGERVSLVQMNSLFLTREHVLTACGGNPCVFSVDGGHTAELAAHDVRLAAESICEGGLVIIDDCFNESWPGVAEGVIPLLAAQLLIPVVIGGNKTICTNAPRAAALYRAAFDLPETRYWQREVTFCGHPTRVVHTRPLGWRRRLLFKVRRGLAAQSATGRGTSETAMH